MKAPWTEAELDTMKARLLQDIGKAEGKYPDIRPLGPLTTAEALELLHALIGAAGTRPLSPDEQFLHGQLLSVYRMAVLAEMLGREGRYFVLSEEDVARSAAGATAAE